MTVSEKLLPLLLKFQKTEIAEHAIYMALAGRIKGPNGELLRSVGQEEKRQAETWKKYTGVTVSTNRYKVRFFLFLARWVMGEIG